MRINDGVYLLTGKDCNACVMVANILKKNKVHYEPHNFNSEYGQKLNKQFPPPEGMGTIPVLIVKRKGITRTMHGVYINTQKTMAAVRDLFVDFGGYKKFQKKGCKLNG